ncbi:MAG TPA: hypothetical protein VGG04_18085 [Candidatus Sulfotelmatobacter sp.]|jgi:hypothetical protein
MLPEKRKRIAPAVLFLFGVLASVRALRDSNSLWPPDVVWASLSPPHRFQLCGGVAVIVVTLVMVAVRKKQP